MDRFTEKVLNFIQKNNMVAAGMGVVVGFSGGVDSTALLSVLDELKGILGIKLYALHLNHGIRQEAGEDEDFCRKFCVSRGISFRAAHRDIPRMAGELDLSEEEAGRMARYEAFNEYLKDTGAERIAVAHHADDVAETLLLNLTRGSGLRGAGAIRPVRDNVIRPLLSITRSEIEEYLGQREISFCTDRTNLENDYTRNFLRNEIIPKLTDKVNKRAAQHLAGAAFSFDMAEEFIRSCAEEALERSAGVTEDRVILPVEALLAEKEIIRRTMVLLMFEKLVPYRKDFGSVHVEAVLSLIGDISGEAFADLPYGLKAARSYDRLELFFSGHRIKSLREIVPCIMEGKETEAMVPGLGRAVFRVFPYDKDKQVPSETYTKWLDYGRIQEVLFRTRRPGDEIAIDLQGGICKKSLNKFMTDVRIPKSRRDEMYILADGGDVLWVPGYRISASHKVSEQTATILEISIIK